MAVTDAYATAATYRAVVEKTSTAEDAEILTDLTAISRYIDRRLGRFFTKDAAAVKRVYMPRSRGGPRREDWAESENPWKYGATSRMLYVDDLVSVTTIKIDTDNDGSFADETALESTDYELTPRNAGLGSEPSPYSGILLTSYGTVQGWTAGHRVEVDGVWGWPSVPGPIERATLHLTGILRLESGRATSRVNDLNQVLDASREAQTIIAELMRNYRKITI